jgi:hypothetical protein
MDLGAFFAASNLKTPQKTGLSAPIPQHQHGTLAGFPLLSLARFRIHDSFLRGKIPQFHWCRDARYYI